MKPISAVAWLLSGVFLFAANVSAATTIAVIGKTKNDSFYEQSYAGCLAYARDHAEVKCIYDGPADYQDIRGQAWAVASVLEQRVDGILISTTDSGYLTEHALKKARQQNIPVITFDSDLMPEDQSYRLAYVGTNNFDYGVALGGYANKFRANKFRAKNFNKAGTTEICIQSGHKTTPNLNDRIRGVRYALSGNQGTERLEGQNGWVESHRCPFYTGGKRNASVLQLEYILSKNTASVFLAVAGFAQFSPDYIERIMPFKHLIDSSQVAVISADTEAIQLKALKAGLSTINIGQRPY